MADYIGGRPKRKGRGLAQFLLIVTLAVAVGAAYLYYNYIWPHREQTKVVAKLITVEKLLAQDCKEGDARCQEDISKALHRVRDNAFEQTLQKVLSSPEIAQRLIDAHDDGSICFLVEGQESKKPDEEELILWLSDYGSQKFLDDIAIIERARDLYEAQYLKPTPTLYQLKLLNKLRWRHIPFGRTWRDYTLVARYLEWSATVNGPTQSSEPTPEERRVMKAMKKKPLYFTDANIDRLTYLAKKELTLERLAKVRDAVRRFARDVREIPVGEDRTTLELTWLASRDELHPWLKRRWAGPYVKQEELVDLWECPLAGTRVPKTGAMTLTSYGSDCAEGGEASGEDLALSIEAYARRPKPKENSDDQVVDQVVEKKRREKRNREISILP